MDILLGPLPRREFIEGHCGKWGPRGWTGETKTFFGKEGDISKMSGEKTDTQKEML